MIQLIHAKQTAPIHTKWTNLPKSTVNFDSLPLEIYAKIFFYLPLGSLMELRLLNKHFRDLINNFSHLWEHIYFRLNFDFCPPIHTLREFNLNLPPKTELVEIKCEKALATNFVFDTTVDVADDDETPTTKKFTILMRFLNVQSIVKCMNFVSQCCHRLVIQSFCGCNTRVIPNVSEICTFNYLTFLDVDFSRSKHYFNELAEELIMSELDRIFPNLTRIHIHNCDFPMMDIVYKFLNLKSLKHVQFNSCLNESHENLMRIEKFLKSKYYIQ